MVIAARRRSILFSCEHCPTEVIVRTDLGEDPIFEDDACTSIVEEGYDPKADGVACHSKDGSWDPAFNCPACGMRLVLEAGVRMP
jgi:hypothetical protein